MSSEPLSFFRRAWRRDTLRSLSLMVFPSWRPMVISSRTSGTTVLRPSSSSMMSFMKVLRPKRFPAWGVC